MRLQRMPAYEAEHPGETLSLHEGPETGNHSGRRIARARLAAHQAHAGNELASAFPLPCLPHSMFLNIRICCEDFWTRTLLRVISPPRLPFPPLNPDAVN